MICESKIMSKIKDWANSRAGKKRVGQLKGHYREAVEKFASGQATDSLAAKAETMNRLARELIAIVRKHMPDSLADVCDRMSNQQPIKRTDGSVEIAVRFSPDAIRRNSLWVSGYPNGVDNIVALLNNGYNARDYVYGVWDRNPSAGVITSVREREPLYFMQRAVREFNAKYGKKYNVTASLGSVYEE